MTKVSMRGLIVTALSILYGTFLVPASAEPLSVGVLAGYSGDWGAYGQAYIQGVELALEDPEVRGTIRPIYEDDEFTPQKTLAALRKLTDINGVRVFLIGDTVTAQAVAPIAEKKGLHLLAWASGGKEFTGKKNIVLLQPPMQIEATFTKEYFGTLPPGAELFVSSHTYAVDWAQSLANTSTRISEFPTSPSDFQSIVLRAKRRNAPLLGLCLNPPDNGRTVKAAVNLHFAVPIIGCSFLEATADLSLAREGFEGARFVSIDISPEFRERFRRRTGTTDHLFSAAVIYNGIKFLAAALRRTDGQVPSSLLQYKQPVSSGAGPAFTMKEIDGIQVLDTPLAGYSIQNGEIVVSRSR